MIAVSADRFLEALRQSGLLAVERFDAQVRRSAAEGPPEDARELAARFVRDGLLTSYQADQLLLGQWQSLLIAGKYVVLAPLGVGGMGQVFLTEHVVMRRRSAVKILPARLMADPAAVERFNREARAIAALDHPNIVRAYDIDTANDLHFLVMEYVDGVSLQELVKRNGPVEPAAAANYIAQAALGLQHAHEAGWVHRDVKPANLLLDRAGTVKVLDLGLARLLADDGEPLTGHFDALGTADYLAPEQGIDCHGVDIRADIYSLGATLYFLLTGKPPFSEGTPAQRVLWHQTRQPRPVRELRPEVPPAMATVLDRMLAKEPADRYSEPAAVAQALDPWAAETFPPSAEMAPSWGGTARSDSQSSWARHAGQLGSKLTPAPGRRSAGTLIAGETADVGFAGTMNLPATKKKPRRRRWPVIVGGLAGFALIAAGAIAFWPKQSAPVVSVANNNETERVVEIQHFIGHEDWIENLAFTPDGKRLITGSKDKTARVWDVATGQVLHVLKGHTDTVRGVAALPDNRRAATASWDGSIRLWDLDSGELIKTIAERAGQVWWVACDPAGERLVAAGEGGTVRIWDIESAQPMKRLTGHFNTSTAALFLPDGRRVVSASEDGTVRVWDLATRKASGPRKLPKMIYRISLSPNGRWVLFGCDHAFCRWDPDGELHATPVPGSEGVESAVALPDGRVVLALLDGTIRVWDVDSNRELFKVPGTGQAMLALAVAPDGKHIASGGRDNIARLWRLPEK